MMLPGLVTGADADQSFLSSAPLITVSVLPNRSTLTGGDPISCTLILLLRGHGESGIWTPSREKEILRLNSRIRAGVVETTRDVKNGRFAKTTRSVAS